jgi:hypothetical protein
VLDRVYRAVARQRFDQNCYKINHNHFLPLAISSFTWNYIILHVSTNTAHLQVSL